MNENLHHDGSGLVQEVRQMPRAEPVAVPEVRGETEKAIDGGPAFPNDGGLGAQGMSIRDYFAAQAMVAVLSGFIARGEGPTSIVEQMHLSRRCYEQADSMLEARK